MKRKYFTLLLVVIGVVFAGYTVHSSHQDKNFSEVNLANLEALADENDSDSETEGSSQVCYKKWRKADADDNLAMWKWICKECEAYWLLEGDYKSTCIK